MLNEFYIIRIKLYTKNLMNMKMLKHKNETRINELKLKSNLVVGYNVFTDFKFGS